MKKYGIVLGAALPFGLAIGNAQAAPIIGSISLSDFGLTLPTAPSNSVVSALVGNTLITQGTPGAGNCTGNFGASNCPLLPAATAGSFTANSAAGVVYTYGGFTFTLTSAATGVTPTALVVSAANGQGVDFLSMTLHGTVTGNGFDPTTFTGSWTSQGTCTGTAPNTCTGNISGSWSASLTANGQTTTTTTTQVPEPASLALLGSALIGFGLARRRRA